MRQQISGNRIWNVCALLLCIMLVVLPCTKPSFAASSSDNGRDAHSESMTVGPDGTEESAHEATDSYDGSDSGDSDTVDNTSDSSDTISASDGTEDEEETSSGPGTKFWVALAAIGIAIVADLYYIGKRAKQRINDRKNRRQSEEASDFDTKDNRETTAKDKEE